jgi:hypothetical protein
MVLPDSFSDSFSDGLPGLLTGEHSLNFPKDAPDIKHKTAHSSALSVFTDIST